jgi:hypothetical protein
MPGVRYGPDISDDAAFVVDRVKELQEKLRRGGKLDKRELKNYERDAAYAKDLFGVGRDRFDRGQFGEMGEMARYGGSKSRSKLARSWRTGGDMKKSVAQEFADRGGGVRRAGGAKTPQGAWYAGRTRPKKFRDLEARAQRRANRNGVRFGAASIAKGSVKPGTFMAEIDKLNVARARGGKKSPGATSDIANRPRGVTTVRKAGESIRPALPKSQIRAQQRARKRAVAGATRDLTNKGRTGGRRR